MNRYALWKYLLILFAVVIGVIYALPNIYGSNPALQISSTRGSEVNDLTKLQAQIALDDAGLPVQSMELQENSLLIRFHDEELQLQAQDIVKQALGKGYVVALNLAPATPSWLQALGAEPMFLGLDLRGGVHFLMEVDMDAAIRKAEERYVSDLRSLFRENKVRYKTITRRDQGGVLIRYRDLAQQQAGAAIIDDNFNDINVDEDNSTADEPRTTITLTEKLITETRKHALQQNITTLRKRVNELGVAEPVIQQQGNQRVVVELPGVQDTARAKDILGATATLEFRLVDTDHNVQEAVDGRVPAGSRLYYNREGRPMLLDKDVMLTGDYI
ncbi:MAG TPA: protein translocase subunit SecD, partial [Gammaproteobacteria bacterium]|nr:protein translocase subunit SecD [Gammaproteobacteria bacterium]